MITRRNILVGLLASPAIIRTPGLLMPVKPIARAGDLLASNPPLGTVKMRARIGSGYIITSMDQWGRNWLGNECWLLGTENMTPFTVVLPS